VLHHGILDRQAAPFRLLSSTHQHMSVFRMPLLSCRTPKWFASSTARFVVAEVRGASTRSLLETHMQAVQQTVAHHLAGSFYGT
jgi:hypothetical protein